MAQRPPGGKVNAANLNFLGLNGLAVVLGTETVAIQPPDGGPLVGVLVSQIGGGGGGQVDSVVGGNSIDVDATDPVNPIVNLPDPLLLGNGSAANPTYSFAADTNLGFYRHSSDDLGWAGVEFRSSLNNGPGLRNRLGTTTIPNIMPDRADDDTGLGNGVAVDDFTLVAGGVLVANIREVGGAAQFVAPLQNNAALPSIAFGVAGSDGFYQNIAGNINVATAGVSRWIWSTVELKVNAGGATIDLKNAAATATVPAYTFNNDEDTGIGRSGADALTAIANGVQVVDFTPNGLRSIDGTSALPTYSFLSDPSAGIWLAPGPVLTFSANTFKAALNAGPVMINLAALATVPTLCPNSQDANTGLGWNTFDNLSLVAGGLEAIRAEDPADLAATETSLWLFDDDNGTMEQVTVGVADSGGVGFKLLRIVN